MKRTRRKQKKPAKTKVGWIKQNWKSFLALGIVTGVRNFFFTRGVTWAATRLEGLDDLAGDNVRRLD